MTVLGYARVSTQDQTPILMPPLLVPNAATLSQCMKGALSLPEMVNAVAVGLVASGIDLAPGVL